MTGAQRQPGQPAGTTSARDIDASALNEKLALEVLRQAQAMVQAQLAAVDALNAKLSSTMGQASTLALAALGAAAIAAPRPDGGTAAWLPTWAAAGLAAAALAWTASALVALNALGAKRWKAAAWRPSLLWRSDLLNEPCEAVGYLMLAASLEPAITDNEREAGRLAKALRAAQALLGGAVPCGAIVAALASAWLVTRWLVPPVLVLAVAHAVRTALRRWRAARQ